MREHSLKNQDGEGKSDPLTFAHIKYLILCSLVGGFMCGVGLDGGAIFWMMFMQLGVPHKAATASTSYTIMFSSAVGSILYLYHGYLLLSWAVVFAVLAIIVTALSIVMTPQRVSWMVFVFAAITACATVAVPVFQTNKMIQEIVAGIATGSFGKFC
jgi:uncharacterized membrane protein YfcA